MSYNLTDGGQGQLGVRKYGKDSPFYGHTQSEEAKRKISDAQIGAKNNMYGTHAPVAIQIDGKYLTDYAKELNVPYARFYLYFIRHNRDLQKTINFYKTKFNCSESYSGKKIPWTARSVLVQVQSGLQ